jgi:SAM-dependent methyltransferase
MAHPHPSSGRRTTDSAPAQTAARIRWSIRNALAGPNRRRARQLVDRIAGWIPTGAQVIDIGSGVGLIAQMLHERGLNVTPVDVRDFSLSPRMRPLLFDGARLPFNDDSMDVSLLITVLHHLANPDASLCEAARVARRVIVLEDLVESPAERALTHLGDSWLNWQWRSHPHSNRSDAEWRATFARLGLSVTHTEQHVHWFFPWRFRHGLFVLDR